MQDLTTMSEEYKCDICGAPATVHLTQIVDGKIHKVHLCEKCAAKSKVAELPILKFTEMLAKTLAAGGKKAAQEISSTEDAGRTPSKVCPACGMTDIVFEKKHLIGCPRCYEIFSEEIDALLPEIQPGRRYCGDAATEEKKSPAAEPAHAAVPIEELRNRLKAAVLKEDYALATALRDEIRRAEKAANANADATPAKAAKKPSATKKRSRASAGTPAAGKKSSRKTKP